MKNLMTVFDFVFGCHHENLSRVFTINKQSYKVCCDCGRSFDYSLETMSIQPRKPHHTSPAIRVNPHTRTA